jgi:hypothetical protein
MEREKEGSRKRERLGQGIYAKYTKYAKTHINF